MARSPRESGVNWKMEELFVKEPGPNELIVRMVATGICHTDLLAGTRPASLGGVYPRVFGHEGAGVVEAIGANVKAAGPGDFVMLSFSFCGTCAKCKAGYPGFCHDFLPLNHAKGQGAFRSASSEDVRGLFIGQSSFSSMALATENSITNVSGIVKDEEDLKLYSPLGCGFMTGAGAVAKLCKATAQDVVVIMGLGGVGLAALMAAKIAGCTQIIAIDRVKSRLEVALLLGASEIIDTSGSSLNLVAEVRGRTHNFGPSLTIDTSGNAELIRTGYEFTGKMGKMVIVGTPPPDAVLEVNLYSALLSGKTLVSSISGNVIPNEFIPEMIGWHRDGKFPIERIIEYFKAEDFQTAIDSMHSGSVIKPVLVW